jgi:hypothetical protein
LANGNASQNRVITFTIRAPVFTGLTSLTNKNSDGFLNATTVQLQRSFVSNIAQRLFQYTIPTGADAAIALNNVTIAIAGNPKLYYTIFTVDDSIPLPTRTLYPVLDYGTNSTTVAGNVVATGGNVTIQSQVLNLSVIPRCIYAWLAVSNASKSTGTVQQALATTDAPAFQITGLNLSFN